MIPIGNQHLQLMAKCQPQSDLVGTCRFVGTGRLELRLDNVFPVQLLATVCTTLGCLLNGTAIAYTGPALPSLLNITGDPDDGTDIWAGDIVINAQEASWIGKLNKIFLPPTFSNF